MLCTNPTSTGRGGGGVVRVTDSATVLVFYVPFEKYWEYPDEA